MRGEVVEVWTQSWCMHTRQALMRVIILRVPEQREAGVKCIMVWLLFAREGRRSHCTDPVSSHGSRALLAK